MKDLVKLLFQHPNNEEVKDSELEEVSRYSKPPKGVELYAWLTRRFILKYDYLQMRSKDK